MRWLVKITVVLLLCGIATTGKAQQKLVLSTLEQAPKAAIAAEILKTAYAKLGIETEFYFTSGQRSLVMSSKGVVDGEVLRIASVGTKYPTLLRVDVPLIELNNLVFVNRCRSSGEVSWT